MYKITFLQRNLAITVYKAIKIYCLYNVFNIVLYKLFEDKQYEVSNETRFSTSMSYVS